MLNANCGKLEEFGRLPFARGDRLGHSLGK